MLRTIAIRGEMVKGQMQKVIQANVVRALSTQCSRKRNITHKALLPTTSGSKWTNTNTSLVARFFSSDHPPHTKVNLPALSPTMEEGTLISWEKKVGDKLNEGDLLAEIETDKATMAFETPEEGYLAQILVPAGTKGVPIGKLVCIIVEKEEHVAAFKDYKDDSSGPVKAAAPPTATTPAPPPPQPAAPISTVSVVTPAATSPGSENRVYASPMARGLAEQHRIRLHGTGTGLYGSITSSDLSSLQPPAAPTTPSTPSTPSISSSTHPSSSPSPFTDIPVTGMRAVIAKRLVQSKQQVPHYYLTVEVAVDEVLAWRERANRRLEKDKVRLSVNDFVLKAVAAACRKVPEGNSSWMDTVIRQYSEVDISVAVSTPRGLLTPIIFGANRLGVAEIHKQMVELAGKARDGKLQPHEFQGGTISVSNLGMFGVKEFAAIVNPPQSCILAVGTTTSRLVVDESAEKGFKSATFMTVTLSSDHRVVDGAVGARWLQAFKEHMEQPETMIL